MVVVSVIFSYFLGELGWLFVILLNICLLSDYLVLDIVLSIGDKYINKMLFMF